MVLFAITILVVMVIYIIRSYNIKREEFVTKSSMALRSLQEINSKYSFLEVPCFDMEQDYDNEHYYDMISPEDFLSYRLIRKQKAVKKAISDAAKNREKVLTYQAEISSTCILGKFDSISEEDKPSRLDRILKNYWLSKGIDRLCSVEKYLFDENTLKPITELVIDVDLYLTNIRGRRLTYKSESFHAPVILKIINRLQEQENGIYLDYDLWQAICRVERGKVSNRMRFAIYQRDGYQCVKCGSSEDLEVDHIFPISRGGKTTFDNLQTLCHTCNTQKSNFIEPSAVTQRYMQNNSGRICPNCRIALVRRRGPYGEFWGCPNYPRCRYTTN